MNNNFNGIGFNPNQANVYSKGLSPKDKEQGKTKIAPPNPNPVPTPKPPKPDMKPDAVLDFMNQQAVNYRPNVNATKTYDVNKYVNAEQAARIANLMASFEDKVAEGLKKLEQEPGMKNLNDAMKYEIAAKLVD